LLERFRARLAWHYDRGVWLDESWARQRLDPRARVCDLGCGNGSFLALLSRAGHDVIGVEPDPRARTVAQGRGLRILVGSAEEPPQEIRGERFDCVLMSHVLEHCLDPVCAVRSAAALLNDQGTLVIETPNNQARGLGLAQAAWPWLDVPRHLNFFTTRSLHVICAAAGLAVRDVEYSGYTRQFEPDWRDSERQIRTLFSSLVDSPDDLAQPPRPTSAWKLLLATAWSSGKFKYDSVRVLAGRSVPPLTG
jgi:SAM-dependent methyltransferase